MQPRKIRSHLHVSADLVGSALNNVLLVSTGLGTAGLSLGHVGHGLGLGLGTVGLGPGLIVSADPDLITSLALLFPACARNVRKFFI
jgi:hypothetical protein